MIYRIPSPRYQSAFSDNSEQKSLIFKVGALDFILLVISIALSEIDMN